MEGSGVKGSGVAWCKVETWSEVDWHEAKLSKVDWTRSEIEWCLYSEVKLSAVEWRKVKEGGEWDGLKRSILNWSGVEWTGVRWGLNEWHEVEWIKWSELKKKGVNREEKWNGLKVLWCELEIRSEVNLTKVYLSKVSGMKVIMKKQCKGCAVNWTELE